MAKSKTTQTHPGGLAVFAERVVREARPPIDDATLAKIAARCAGPIPDGLVALWRTTFGGTLDYDLRATFGDHEASVSFTELFYPGSDGYRDLWGWIEHEEELAQGAAEEDDDDGGKEWSGKLDFLPFGGFEYLDRVYVRVTPGKDHGAVYVWMQGLPPAWRFHLHEDSTVRIADDVPSLFRLLVFEQDPRTGGSNVSGKALVDAIDALEDASAVQELREIVGRAVLDWRRALDEGTIGSAKANARALRHLAIEHAARNNDVALLERLASAGCDLTEPLRGKGGAIDHALACDAKAVVRFLLDRKDQSVLIVKDAIRNGAARASVELVRELLQRGAEPDVIAALTAVGSNHLESGLAIAEALLEREPTKRKELVVEANYRAKDNDESAERLEAGKLTSNMSAADYRANAERYRSFLRKLEK